MTDTDKPFGATHRVADDPIYLNEDRRAKPKETFKQMGELLRSDQRGAGTTVLDAGCATGELLGYLKDCFPDYQYAGYDISEDLVATAKERFPDIDFTVASVTEPAPFPGRTFDVVLCSGVVGIFDDLNPVLNSLMGCVNPGGTLLIGNTFNENPIDVLVRYRPSEDTVGPWQSGWNIFSKHTVERILRELDPGIEINWHRFRMPFAIPKTNDPMRSWTIETAEDPFQQTSGASQLRKIFMLQARRTGG